MMLSFYLTIEWYNLNLHVFLKFKSILNTFLYIKKTPNIIRLGLDPNPFNVGLTMEHIQKLKQIYTTILK